MTPPVTLVLGLSAPFRGTPLFYTHSWVVRQEAGAEGAPRGYFRRAGSDGRVELKFLVAVASAADAQKVADLARNDLHVWPPRLIRVDAGCGRGLDQQRDGAPEIGEADDLRREGLRMLALVVVIHIRHRDRGRAPAQSHERR